MTILGGTVYKKGEDLSLDIYCNHDCLDWIGSRSSWFFTH